MTTKIRIKVGGIEVDYEGSESFLNQKLHKLVSDLSTLAKQVPAQRDVSDSSGNTKSGASITMASFLKENKADSQIVRFLATAQWLHLKGSQRIMTSDITKALRESNQKRLSNPSDSLNQNVSKGFCEKEGKAFFVTPEGKDSLTKK